MYCVAMLTDTSTVGVLTSTPTAAASRFPFRAKTGVFSPRVRVAFQSAFGPLAVAAAAGLLAAPELIAPLSSYDGGITASAATFIRHGQIPYRDFWLLYGPLAGYLGAALTAIFGSSVLVLRLAGLALVMIGAAVGYQLIRGDGRSKRRALIAILAAAIPVYSNGLDLGSWQLGMTLALLALLVGVRGTNRALLLAGGIVGLAALARLDLGAYAMVALIIQARSLRPVIGAVLVFAPFAIFFVALTPLQALVQQLFWYPLVGQQQFRRVAGPTILGLFTDGENIMVWTIYYLPVFAILGVVARRLRTGAIPTAFVGLTMLALLGRLQTVTRADLPHAAQVFGVGLLLTAYIIGEQNTFARRMAMALPTAFLCGITVLPCRWFMVPKSDYDQALIQASAIVSSRTSPDEPIFVGEITNENVVVNPLVVYFLADRRAGVLDTMYNPGITTTADTQALMVEQLASNHVRYLILDREFAGCFEPSNGSGGTGSTILDQAIARNYVVVADYGSVVVMASRDSNPAPVDTSGWVDSEPPCRQ